VETDLDADDQWPRPHDQLIASDILIMATPVWLGQLSRIAQLIRRWMDAMAWRVSRGSCMALIRQTDAMLALEEVRGRGGFLGAPGELAGDEIAVPAMILTLANFAAASGVGCCKPMGSWTSSRRNHGRGRPRRHPV